MTTAIEDCLFCKIINGSIPSNKVLESELSYAFRDINPVAPSHVLVVPKNHITDASDLDGSHSSEFIDGMLADLFLVANKVAKLEEIDGSGYRMVFNVGKNAGNTVPHLHLHVLGGRLLGWPPG